MCLCVTSVCVCVCRAARGCAAVRRCLPFLPPLLKRTKNMKEKKTKSGTRIICYIDRDYDELNIIAASVRNLTDRLISWVTLAFRAVYLAS